MTKKIDQELYLAISKGDIQQTKRLIADGADLLAIISFHGGKRKKQPFLHAVEKSNLNLLSAVLESAYAKYQQTGINPLDLSRTIIDGENLSIDKENILQDVVCRSSLTAIKQVINYAKKTKQDVEYLLNAPILSAADNFTTGNDLSIALINTLSSDNINANLNFSTSTDMTTVSKFWGKWFLLDPDESMDELQKVTLPIQLIYNGPIETLPYLMEQGLKVDKPYLEYITALSQEPEYWDERQASIHQPSVIPTSKAAKIPGGGIYFAAELGNSFDAHQIPITISIDYTPLKQIVEDTEQKLMHKYNIDKIASDVNEAKAGVTSLNTRVDALTTEMRELKQEFSKLAEVQKQSYRAALADDEIALQLFNHLEGNTKAQLEGGKIAALKIFNAQPSSTTQQYASSAIAVLNFATNSIPIAQNVMSCIAFCQKEYAKIQTKKHYKNVVDKTLGIDAPIVAINVAGHIAGKYLAIKEMLQSKYNSFEWLKSNMWNNVQTASKKLGSMQGNFVNLDHLVAYLCTDAIHRLSNAELYKIGVFDNNVHNLHRQHSPGYMPVYAASSSTALSTSTVAMNMAYTEISGGYDYQQSYSSSTDNSPPLVFSSRSGKKTPSPKSDNTIQSNHSGSNHSAHSSRSSGKKKKPTSKCSIM